MKMPDIQSWNSVRKTVQLPEVGCAPGANLWYLSREGFDAGTLSGDTPLEFRAADGGPPPGKGFFRLLSLESLEKLYTGLFHIQTIDLQEYTGNNRAHQVGEWVVVAAKHSLHE